MSTPRPEYHLQRVDSDGTTGPLEIYPVGQLPDNAHTSRRGFLGTGLTVAGLLALLSGCSEDPKNPANGGNNNPWGGNNPPPQPVANQQPAPNPPFPDPQGGNQPMPGQLIPGQPAPGQPAPGQPVGMPQPPGGFPPISRPPAGGIGGGVRPGGIRPGGIRPGGIGGGGIGGGTICTCNTICTCIPVYRPSDRNLKENFAPVDVRSVLERLAALPIQLWNYTEEGPAVRHLGPMAQDFAAAFGVGPDDRCIAGVDADGVAFAAIQGLYELLKARDAQLQQRTALLQEEIDDLREQNMALATRLEALEALVKAPAC